MSKKPKQHLQKQHEADISSVLKADITLIKQDLLKTVYITLLLLAGIFGIVIYLR